LINEIFQILKIGGNSGFFMFFSWEGLFLGYKWMLVGSLRGLGKKGKKKRQKMEQKRARI